jgi:dTDP-4-amino-4,6-dideoxygalactose transaminase
MRNTFLPFSLPSIGEEEISEVVDSLRSGWVTTGPKVKRFESDFSEYIGTRHAIAVNSCTGGLHIALAALGIGPGDEVIVPTLTFCSTANVVIHLGAKPVLVDVGEDFSVTPEAIKKAITLRTKAIIPVHYGGQSCDLKPIYEIAAQHNLAVVEDAAHAVGSSYHNSKIGSDILPDSRFNFKRATVFSFYPIKNMTTGEGGMITTSDDALAERMRLLTLHGMSRDAWMRYKSNGSWYYEVIIPGFKYNMMDIQAALGIHQLRKLNGFIETRQHYAQMYDQGLIDLPEIKKPTVHSDRNHVYHLYVIQVDHKRLTIDRGQFIEEVASYNIGTSVHFVPVHMHPFYRDRFGYQAEDFPTALSLYKKIVSIPLYPKMSEDDIQYVIWAIHEIVKKYRR